MFTLLEFAPAASEIKCDVQEIASFAGYDPQKAPAIFVSETERLLAGAMAILQPKCGFIVVPPEDVTVGSAAIQIHTTSFNTGKIIRRPLKNIGAAVLFIGSTGSHFENWLSDIKTENDPFKTYCADLIGSILAEQVAGWVHGKVQAWAKEKKWSSSNRYSPGYCGWDVADQIKLFSFFPDNFCGVTVSQSALMKPVKSVSGLIGLGENIQREAYDCYRCNAQHCYKNV